MRRYLTIRALCRVAIAAALGIGLLAAAQNVAAATDALITLASAKFPNLTRAERAMLAFAAASDVQHGQFAVADSRADPADPSNDPKHADEWPHERDVRASLITWLCEDPEVTPLINRAGIKILGARIVGGLDLSHVRVPFALSMRNCAIAERIALVGTEVPHLDLDGSYISEIDGIGLIVHGDLDLANGFHASGETRIEDARIDGTVDCNGGYFHYSKVSQSQYSGALKPALILDNSTIGASVGLAFGFRSEGAVLIRNTSVADDVDMWGAVMSNPHNVAFRCNFSSFGSVFMGSPPVQDWGNFDSDGLVEFVVAQIRTGLVVNGARFLGSPAEPHGFSASGLNGGFLFWKNVQLQNDAIVDLSLAHVGVLLDEERSWPAPGNLQIDGLTYDRFGAGSPVDVETRLRWISLQPQARDAFRPQPYRQLAKVYRESGLDNEAIHVLIAEEDARFARYGPFGRLWGVFLKGTIGYGHRPLRAIFWSIAVVLLGTIVIAIAKSADVMRRTYPENAPATADEHYERLYPLLYSLDVFLPFVNLHQEHYWWPKATANGNFALLGYQMTLPGSLVLYYLWLQIIAGWLLSAIFVAGVTGLIRND